ncbi:MAG: FAD-binding oxidoreductase [Pirellulales bacterium]
MPTTPAPAKSTVAKPTIATSAGGAAAGASGVASLPLARTVTAREINEVAATIRDAAATATPVYPWGGATSLDYGLPAKTPGVGLALNELTRVIDYPARDMTVTVEAGMTVAELARTLAAERQQLPFDVPRAGQATVGGVVATNWNGPRRYGYGSVRDYVIGISAVDGRGTPFKGGGRVVKNVAGYDFCKLLTGSLGSLGVITQLTFRLRPLVERTAWIGCGVATLADAERLLASLVTSATTPTAIELLAGPEWRGAARLAACGPAQAWVLVQVEGDEVETAWMIEQLKTEWHSEGVKNVVVWQDADASAWSSTLAEYSQQAASPLVVQGAVRPSGTTALVATLQQVDPEVSVQCHAGNGLVLGRFSQFPAAGMSRAVVGGLQSAAAASGGSLVIVSNPSGQESTIRAVWGVGGATYDVMTQVKRQFDPANVLNTGRFVFP